MKFAIPERIEIKLLLTPSLEPAKDVIASLFIVAENKNDYPLGFFSTDSEGLIRVDRSHIDSSIKSSQHEYPMDYSYILNTSCKIRISIDSGEVLRDRVARLRKFYPDEANRLLRLLALSSNDNIIKTESELDCTSKHTKIYIQESQSQH